MGSRCRSCRKFTGIPSSAIPIPSLCPSPANESAMCMCPRRPRTAKRCIPPLRGCPGGRPRLRPQPVAEGHRPVRPSAPGLGELRPQPQGAVRRADPDGLRNGEARRRVLSVHQSSRRRRQRIFRRGEEERPAGRPRRRLRLPGIFPHLLLRESEDDSEEPAGVRGTDSLRRVVKYFPYYDGNGSGDS